MIKPLTIFLVLSASFMLTGCSTNQQSVKSYNDPYNREAAVAYSYLYTETRNPEYPNFDSNCTNYISQCLIAGGKQMDTPQPAKQDNRITYYEEEDQWFCTYIHTNPKRWKEFSTSLSFCSTDDFLKYWVNYRGMTFSSYVNSMDGLIKLYDTAEIGDIIVLYNSDGEISHLCIISSKDDKKLLINANTSDYKDHNVLRISHDSYPQIGLLKMS